MGTTIAFEEISGQANIVLGMAKLSFARLKQQVPFVARLLADRALFKLLREMKKMVRGVATIDLDLVSDALASEFFKEHYEIRTILLPFIAFLKAEGNWLERTLAAKMEAAWDELEDFNESLQLAHRQDLMETLSKVASTIPESARMARQDWRDMLAKL